jgi:hypothetical protein
MLFEQVGRESFVKDWGVQERITAQREIIATALQVDGFRDSPAQIHRQHLVLFFSYSVEKWQRHKRVFIHLTIALQANILFVFAFGTTTNNRC